MPTRQRGDGDAAAIQNSQAVDEAFAGLAEQLRCGQAAIGEDHFAGGAGAHAQLVFLLADAKSGRALLENESRDAVLRRRRGRSPPWPRRHRRYCALVVKVLPPFRTQQSPSLNGLGARAGGIRAGFGFGQRPAADPFARWPASGCSVLLLLVVPRQDKCDSCRANCARRRSARPNGSTRASSSMMMA